MPQADIYYSNTLSLDLPKLFIEIEKCIHTNDRDAGKCKCRAHPIKYTHHTYILVIIKLLKKPHRDDAFMDNILEEITPIITEAIPKECHYSIELDFLSKHYETGIQK